VLIKILPDTSPVCGASITGGSIYSGFVIVVLLTCTVLDVGVISNTAGVVVEEDVTSKPPDPVKLGTPAPELITLDSSTSVTIEGSVGPTDSTTIGGRAGVTSTIVEGLEPKGT
jgi:hypothetical protein